MIFKRHFGLIYTINIGQKYSLFICYYQFMTQFNSIGVSLDVWKYMTSMLKILRVKMYR